MDTPEKMTVLIVEPGKAPYPKEIETSLEAMQEAVGGYIEAVYPYEDPVGLVVNEEGKLDGLPLNRALRDEDGSVYDIVAGTMLIVGLNDETFCSLTDDMREKFAEKFRVPEQFIRLNGKLTVLPMEEIRRKTSEIPVYRHPAAYANEHGQLDQYRESRKANIACKDAIEAAISENYRDNRLDHAAAQRVVNRFGMERVAYVLSVTIRDKDWDGRISRDNKAWAQKIPVQENRDTWGQDRNLDFVITQAHPGLIDLFASQVRKMEKEKERPSVMEKLRKQVPAPIPMKKGREQER